ncbi:efflux RND transporter permease subunit [Bradyrhizobium sp. USDA 3397]
MTTELSIKRPVLSIVVSFLILLIGLRAATLLPIRQYPKLSSRVINITTSYPGATADTCGERDLRLPLARGAAGYLNRRRGRNGRDAGWPEFCDAAMARPSENGWARRVAG